MGRVHAGRPRPDGEIWRSPAVQKPIQDNVMHVAARDARRGTLDPSQRRGRRARRHRFCRDRLPPTDESFLPLMAATCHRA